MWAQTLRNIFTKDAGGVGGLAVGGTAIGAALVAGINAGIQAAQANPAIQQSVIGALGVLSGSPWGSVAAVAITATLAAIGFGRAAQNPAGSPAAPK